MSTDYTILEKDGLVISLEEHSNVFDLALDFETDAKDQPRITALYLSNSSTSGDVSQVCTHTPTLTPEDVISMAVQCLKVASYWMDPDEFQAACRKHFGAETGALSSMAQAFSKL